MNTGITPGWYDRQVRRGDIHGRLTPIFDRLEAFVQESTDDERERVAYLVRRVARSGVPAYASAVLSLFADAMKSEGVQPQ